MSTTKQSVLKMASVTSVNLLTLATSFPYVNQIANIVSTANSSVEFLSFNDTFTNTILGPNVSQQLISQQSYEAFHEAGVYNLATNSLYMASNWLVAPNSPPCCLGFLVWGYLNSVDRKVGP